MKIVERNVQQIGQSLLISLPKEWTKLLKVKKGAVLKLIISEQGNLSIAPDFVHEEKKQEASILFDPYFKGRFFRAYFGGNEKITFLLKDKLSENQRKEFYAFIRRFMNVQVIEETSTKITLKCFKIEELSIEECLKRMHFLLLTLFEEIAESKDKMKIAETKETMIRFYYMLIMQIRRYLTEGKFVEGNQISLIKAMDYRMVAEKIHRLGTLVGDLENKVNIKELHQVKELYSKTFNYYLNEMFEESAHLLFDLDQEEKEIKDPKLKPILRYSIEICRLTK